MVREPDLFPVRFPDYDPPQAAILPVEPGSVLCESPIPGGNEGIGYENWG